VKPMIILSEIVFLIAIVKIVSILSKRK